MRYSISVSIALATMLALTSCAGRPQPVPTASSSGGAADDHGWLLEITTSLLTASEELCFDDPIVVDPSSHDAAIFAIGDGVANPENTNGVSLNFSKKSYELGFLDGTTRDGTYYELRGPFSYEVDSEGVPISGSGTATGRVLLPSGDVDHSYTDSMSFTMTPIPAPEFCSFVYEE